MGQQPHALVVPFPAQGHVIPLLELSYCLVDHGFKITFVNTEINHALIAAALPEGPSMMDPMVRLISFDDGLAPGEDRRDLLKLRDCLMKTLPMCLEELILKSHEPGEDKITCMVADGMAPWVLEVAREKGLRSAAFWPMAAAVAATIMKIPKLIEDGVIDADGFPMKQEMFQLAPGLPLMNPAHLTWNCYGDRETQKEIFHLLLDDDQRNRVAEFFLCNSSYDMEQPVFAYSPKILPVGPLLTGQRLGKPVGHLWPEDRTCEAWLDQQRPNSVVYVAFGSLTTFDRGQFQELALGLELCDRPFLWVVRPDLVEAAIDAYPHGFRERVALRGRIVGWAPQQRVLAHPSVACFMSHCGWNSTLEGVRNGLPFLCWPYFVDQFLNQSYICDVWRIGSKMMPDENVIVSKEQIKSKVDELLLDEDTRERARLLKELAQKSARNGGSSFENLKRFADAMKHEGDKD
ncbi:UDP-glycosyltransferase 83A1-like [Musa acuminata AAA Group]|uniref:UDP-glycosyltransferase 83A1-like n=1 Tax=Musa acuminata AAA Group TaxID=214697 RepID=UPI0031E24318